MDLGDAPSLGYMPIRRKFAPAGRLANPSSRG